MIVDVEKDFRFFPLGCLFLIPPATATFSARVCIPGLVSVRTRQDETGRDFPIGQD